MIKPQSIIAAAVATLSVSATVTATGWSGNNSSWQNFDTSTLSDLPYVRTAPDASAAFRIPVGRDVIVAEPDLFQALPQDLEVDNSERKRDELKIWGPWLSSTGVSDNTRQLIAQIENSSRHGLAPRSYGLALLKQDIARRERAATVAAFESAAERSTRLANTPSADTDAIHALELAHEEGRQLEQRLEAAFVRLSKHLGEGVVDPRDTQRSMFRSAPKIDAESLTSQLADGSLDVNTALRSVMPTHADYRRLVSRMDTLLTERASGEQRTQVPETGSLRVGHHHDDVMFIKRRLVETGEIHPETVLTPMFDAPLKLAVANFQKRHGIPQSGIVDKRTRDALNIDVDDAITDVALSLERWRWMPRDLGERHFFMNLPSYRLSMRDQGEEVVDMVVVVGSEEHPTPTFSQNMTYIQVNPTWSVPQSIAHRSLLPKEIASPGYLRDRNFDFLKYQDGKYKRVAYDSVTPAELRKRPFPYLLRQRAGSDNALGTMKFMMPNPYAIYFHDTQAKDLFALPERAYSSGCIRLSDPQGLLRTVLELDGKSERQIQRAMTRTDTKNIILDTPIPSHLAYFTTWVDSEGLLQTRRDMYQHDPSLEDALRLAGTLVSDIQNPGVTARSDEAIEHTERYADHG